MFVSFFGIKRATLGVRFIALKNNKDKEELQCTAGIAS